MEWNNKKRIVIAAVVLVLSVVVFGCLVAPVGISISEAGEEMARIRSVGGNSIAEAYYECHGEIYEGFGKIITYVSFALCLVGCLVAVWIVLPVIAANKEKINTLAGDMKDRVVSAAQAAAAKHQSAASAAQNYAHSAGRQCANCGMQLDHDAQFCTGCGTPVAVQPAGPKVCASCGNQLADDAAFCTRCGNRV